jgi:hypothetical protein
VKQARGSAMLLICTALTLPTHASRAQHDRAAHSAIPAGGDSAVADFARRARAGAEHYADQSAAVADGYRQLGPDFPAMGEHWANPELVAMGRLDPSRPPLLTYIRVHGVPRLTGVVFALPLGDGESPPATPVAPSAWHDHFGSVEDESLLLDHDAHHAPAGELRLAVLHAWLFVDNPAGTFVTDNWALPYVRLGVPVPGSPPADATRALALIGGTLPYYLALAERAMAAEVGGSERARAVIERHRDTVAAWWAVRRAGAPLTPSDLDALASMWRACWTDLATATRAETAAAVQRIAGS